MSTTEANPNNTSVLQRLFLPFYDSVQDKEGWQFGLPPVTESNLVGYETEHSIKILTRSGEVYSVDYPILQRYSDRPPQPVWAWVPFQNMDSFVYARTIAPARQKGSIPLSEMHDKDCIYTRHGSPSDKSAVTVPFGISNHSLKEGVQWIHLGNVPIAKAYSANHHVEWIQPHKEAYELDLWTSHVVSVVQTRLAYQSPL